MELVFKNSVHNFSDENSGFNDGQAVWQGRVDFLHYFAGFLATMFPTTATVEADLLLLIYKKDEYRNLLTDFSLKGVL